MNKTPTTLIIMDGFGLSNDTVGNAVRAANTPVLDGLFAEYAHTTLQASGLDVGLPAGQMGNSEVGHTNIGGGRVVFQDLPRITRSIEDGTFFENPAYNKAMDDCIEKGSALHLYGLHSTGGVHSTLDHLYALLKMAHIKGLKRVYIHAFLDGRDTPPTSGRDFVAKTMEKCRELGVGKIATVMGRYYAMDRDKRWDRLENAYDALVYGEGVQDPDPIHASFVPLGGGGLAAGVAAYVKNLRPEIRVIGVEPVDSDAMRRSIMAGHRVELKDVGLFADGVAVKLVGEETFALCRDLLDDIITVDTDAICGAIKDIFEDTRVVAEPAGALALAGLRAYARAGNLRDTTLVAVVSGANMNFDRLSHVAERARFGANREALLGVTIPEKAGSFRQLVQAISSRNITELCTRFADPVNAHVLVGIDIKNSDEVASVLEDLRAAGFSACDLTDNELAKLHLRHMVGGNAPQVHNERLIRFFFPERPGALLNFMDAMRVTYNFTLFQYRYHGADFGRVLLGVEVPEERREDFEEFLARVDRMGYPHVDETDNPAYKMFLGWHHDN